MLTERFSLDVMKLAHLPAAHKGEPNGSVRKSGAGPFPPSKRRLPPFKVW